jgi:hypothetical protein
LGAGMEGWRGWEGDGGVHARKGGGAGWGCPKIGRRKLDSAEPSSAVLYKKGAD